MNINTDQQKIKEVLERGVEYAIDKNNLAKNLGAGKRLRVKLGIDPTATDLHLGHAVVLRKLRQFQELGHTAVLIIGDFTTLIGDPSGRTASRPKLTPGQIRDNMKDYIRQAAKVIDIDKTEIHYNSEWFGKEPMSFLMDLAGRFTVARLIEREDFQKRLKGGFEVSMLELLYPLLQGYDSVAIKADIELGGYDQCLNLLFGRKVLRAFDMPEQDIVTVPLLIGTDGVKKMSKSVVNYIKIDEEPSQMFRQIMDIKDNCIWDYFNLLTNIPALEIESLKNKVSGGVNPMDIKKILANQIVAIFSSKESADQAQNNFENFKQTVICELKNIPEQALDNFVAQAANISKSEARRLIGQNGVKINNEIKNNPKEIINLKSGAEIKIGKNKLFKISG